MILNFIKYISFLSVFLSSSNLGTIQEFEENYRFEIENANDHYSRIEQEFITQSKNYGTDYKFISAIVFPELIRYSMYRDFFETTVLEFFYVQKGSEAANFSIGMFQIKPSFVEQIEKEVIKYKLNKYLHITEYSSQNAEEIRSERLNRIKSTKWQITYINCFYSLIQVKFKGINFTSKEKKLAFFATAYNHGFNCSKEEIYKWAKIKSFPNGVDSDDDNYSYSEISQYFYNRLVK